MLTYFENRERIGPQRELYLVRSWYVFGLRVFRRYEQLTVREGFHTASEKGCGP